MLKIISDGERTIIESAGSLENLVCDLGEAIHKIYLALGKQGQKNAKIFRAAMQRAVTDDSPVWENEESSMDNEICLSRNPSEPVKAEDIQKMIRNGATPEQIARYCGGVE